MNHRILVRSPNWIGDQVLAYPFFHFLRESYPSSHIAVICAPWVKDIQFRNLIDQVHVLSQPLHSGWRVKWDMLEQTASLLKSAGPWDLGICLPNSFSAAWLMYRSGVKKRKGYRTDGRSFLLTDSINWDQGPSRHRADAYVRLLDTPVAFKKSMTEFWGILPENDLDPGVPGVVDRFDAEKAWPDAEPMEPPQEKYWVLAPGSMAESRKWPTEYFAQLARLIYEQTGWTGVILGGSKEISIAEDLASESQLKLLDWTARGSVSASWKVFQNAQFAVCNDSGLAHLGALCGSSVQIVWGGGDPKRTLPIGPGRVQMIFNPVECWPCEMNQCTQVAEKKLKCLRGVSPEAVWKEIQTGFRIKR